MANRLVYVFDVSFDNTTKNFSLKLWNSSGPLNYYVDDLIVTSTNNVYKIVSAPSTPHNFDTSDYVIVKYTQDIVNIPMITQSWVYAFETTTQHNIGRSSNLIDIQSNINYYVSFLNYNANILDTILPTNSNVLNQLSESDNNLIWKSNVILNSWSHINDKPTALSKIGESAGQPIWNGSAWPGGSGSIVNTIYVQTTDPLNTFGNNNDIVINQNTWVLWYKESGNWIDKGSIKGTDGTPGLAGIDGIDGKTILTGSVNPTTEGSNGDYYINQDTWHIWYKISNNWLDYGSIKGIDGIDGINGNTIHTGPTIEGVDGDYYINQDTWHIWYKESGNWIDKGSIKGIDGTPGIDGKTILTGSVDPTIEGVDGDYYINQDTWMLWYKESGSWIDKVLIKNDNTEVLNKITEDVDGNPLWDGSAWPGGSGDGISSWNELTDKPTSSVTDIDDAVSKKHDHTNKATLDGTQESFTTVLKNKLDGLSNYTHPESHAASIITQDENNRFVTDTEKTTWNSKAAGNHTHTELHEHTNKSTLDLFTVDSETSELLYNGSPMGSDNNTIITGTVDPITEGIDGDYYINQTTWHVWFKESGSWVDKGSIKGIDGTAGTLIYNVSDMPASEIGIDGDYAIDEIDFSLWYKESGSWIYKGSLKGNDGVDATASIISLTTYACNTYTNDTWTTIYTNNDVVIHALYLTSLTNRSDSSVNISLRLVDSSNNELHRIIDNVALSAYAGLENAYSQYPVPSDTKIQFKASAADCEALLSVGILPNAAYVRTMNPAATNTWEDIYDNSLGSTGFRLALISIANTSSDSVNVDMQVTNSDGTTTIYHLVPPLTLEGNTGVENHTGFFVLGAEQKLQIYATNTNVQFLVLLINNEIVELK